jgi:hypothetical protein
VRSRGAPVSYSTAALVPPQHTVAPEREERSGLKSNFQLPDELDRIACFGCRRSECKSVLAIAVQSICQEDASHTVRLVTQRDMGNVC